MELYIDQFQLLPSPPTPLGICKALCPGGWDFLQQRVAPGVGGGDNWTDRQTHPVARSVTMEEFAGKPTTFVGDWLEKQGIGKLKTLFEGKKHAYVNNFCCFSVARGRGICSPTKKRKKNPLPKPIANFL